MSATTRFSLIARIKDSTDADSWRSFVETYGPFVYGIGRRSGLQDADACDLVQEVMREVARSIDGVEANPAAGKFRGWLSLVTRRTLSRMLKKKNASVTGSGDTAQLLALGQHPAEDQDRWEDEHRQHVFHWAADQVKAQVASNTWEAFWQTAIQGKPPQAVAERLGMSVGSVYIAKSRVQNRLKAKIEQLGDEAI